MSPRTLTRLHHLLFESPRHSSRGTIASRWHQYHGATDWASLLNPLDGNLRRELVRYGDLVQAAYHAFHSHPTMKSNMSSPVAIPDRSYRLTHSLFATASVDLPPWVDRLVAISSSSTSPYVTTNMKSTEWEEVVVCVQGMVAVALCEQRAVMVGDI